MSRRRLVAPEDLPTTLWDVGKMTLHLAPDLVTAWKHLLCISGQQSKALLPAPSKVVGGIVKAATDEHLAWRFNGSSARVQLAMLDPENRLPEVSDAFARIFAGGTVLLTDVPCGSGAASLSILSTLAELRRQLRVPRTPLMVKLVGGELSVTGRDYASKGMQHVIAALQDQAISVEPVFKEWDVLCKFSTADLIKQLTILGDSCSARVLVLANFSDFLQNSGKWKDAEPQLENLFLHSRDQQSVAIWIEPNSNPVINETSGLFSRILNWFSTKFAQLINHDDHGNFVTTNVGVEEAKVMHPLQPGQLFHVKLAVLRFELPTFGAKG